MASMSFDQREFLDRHIPYRLGNLDLFYCALRIVSSDPEPKMLQMVFDTGYTLSGSHGIFTNPAVETGLVASRALLKFLEAKRSNYEDDVLITMFQHQNGEKLCAVPRSTVAKFHPPAISESKTLKALEFTQVAADKGVAHLTLGPLEEDESDKEGETALQLYQVSCLAIRAAIEHHLYEELGLPAPPKIFEHFKRGEL
jgi:hypothetical protein